jgi:glycosyltransferase involved in cell wall biosynthesis
MGRSPVSFKAPVLYAPAVAAPDDPARKLGDIAAAAGLRRIHLLAWRDLDDDEAGGSEVHAHTVARLWAEAGIDVTMRTSFAVGRPPTTTRDGYQVVRRAGRYLVFPRSALAAATGRMGPRDGLVEIWNGMPFLSPIWARGPRVTWLHHVHAEMWQMMLPGPLATVGNLIERRLAPPFYRRTPVVTLSESSRHELVDELGFRADRVTVIPPGIDPVFSPAGEKSPTPLIVAVGRLAPVKRFHLLVDALVALKADHPSLEAVLVGEGQERPALEARIAAAGATGWIHLPGRVSEAELVDLYRRAWAVSSASAREGWGMTITEAAACATPAVVTKISGHSDAVVAGETGLLADIGDLGAALGRVLADPDLRARLSAGAAAHAARYTWAATAEGTLQVLADDAIRRRR